MEHLRDGRAGLFVVVEGNIGAGKSTFGDALARHWRQAGPVEFMPEPIDDPTFRALLGRYYQDPKRWGLTFQLAALKARLRQHTLAAELVANGTTVVQDRSVYADGIFGTLVRRAGLMDAIEWDVYADTFGQMKRHLRYPDVLVYLRTKPSTCFERMKSRARAEEAGVPLDYLERLHAEHETYVREIARFVRVLTVEWDGPAVPAPEVASQIEQVSREEIRFLRDFKRLGGSGSWPA